MSALDELRTRRAELSAQLATLETEAEQANQAAGAAMAGGDSLAKVTVDMEKAAASLRLTRAALAVVDKQILQAVRDEKAAKAGELKAEVDRLDAEYLAVLIQYRAALIETRAAYKRGGVLWQRIMSIMNSGQGIKSCLGGWSMPLVYTDGAIGLLDGILERVLSREELAPLGLKKPPTPLEQSITELERQTVDFDAAMAAHKERIRAASDAGQNTRQLENMTEYMKHNQEIAIARLAKLRGDAPATTPKQRKGLLNSLAGLVGAK